MNDDKQKAVANNVNTKKQQSTLARSICASLILGCVAAPVHSGYLDDLKKEFKKEIRSTQKQAVRDLKSSFSGGGKSSKAKKAIKIKPTTSRSVSKRTSRTQETKPIIKLADSDSEIITDRADIKKAQQYLKRLGFRPGPADGLPGKRTRRAIAAFQSSKNLTVSGELDRKTFEALEKSVKELDVGTRGHAKLDPPKTLVRKPEVKVKSKPVSGQQSGELAAGNWLNNQSISNLLHGNTGHMTFIPAGNSSVVYFGSDGKVLAKNPNSVSFYVANWKAVNNQWCMETQGPTVCYKVKLNGNLVEGWHLENGNPVHSVNFTMLEGDSANLVYEQQKQMARNTNFVDAATVIKWVLAGAALHSAIMGGANDSANRDCFNEVCDGVSRPLSAIPSR